MSSVLTPALALAPSRADERTRRVWGLALLVLWVITLTGALWVGPEPASSADFRAAAAAHDVRAWQVTDRNPQGLWRRVGSFDASGSSTSGTATIEWRDGRGRAHWAQPMVDGTLVSDPGVATPADGQVVTGPTSDTARVEAWAGPLAGGWARYGDVVPQWLQAVLLASNLAVFAAVVVGPRPRRGTRWFWFWLTGLPLGVGVVVLAWREYLGATAPREVARAGVLVDERRRGGFGFFLLFLGSLAVQVVLAAVGARLGLVLL